MTYKSCKKHKGMKVDYDLLKYKGCLLCAKDQQIQLLDSALKGILDYGGLMVDATDLILKGAPDEQLRAVRAKKKETSEKIMKDLEAVADVTASVCL